MEEILCDCDCGCDNVLSPGLETARMICDECYAEIIEQEEG